MFWVLTQGLLSGSKTPGGAFSDTINITINTQSGAAISGTISFSSINLSTTFSGTVSGTNIVNVTFDASATVSASGGFAGQFDGASIIIPSGAASLVIFETGPPFVTYDLAGTLISSGSDIIDPKNASGTSLVTSSTITNQSRKLSRTTAGRTQLRLGNGGKDSSSGGDKDSNNKQGFNFNKNGFSFEGESGLNAGDLQLGNLGVWLSYSYTSSENDFSRTAFESDSHNVVGGVDISPSDDYILGLAISYEISDTDTTFNQGNLITDGVTVVPYMGILLSDQWSMDASFGYGWLSNDQYRTSAGTRITSNVDSSQWFYSMNLNGITFYNNWIIGGRAGVLFAKSETDSFTESNGVLVGKRETTLGEFQLGGDVAYSFGEFEPYIGAVYERDFIFDEILLTSGPQAANDRDDILVSGGFRYFGNQGLTANFEYSKRLLREQFEEDSVRMNLRYNW